MRQDKPPRWWGAVVISVMLIATACTTDAGEADDQGLAVVATTTVWADVAASIIGDHGTVTSLIPEGVDPHAFSPSPAEVASLVEADLVIANGLGLEASFADVLEAAEDDGVVVVRVGDAAEPVSFGDRDQACDPKVHDDHGACDPHVWMDPIRVGLAVEAIVAALMSADPSVDWEASAAGYLQQLEVLADDMSVLLGSVPVDRRVLVTNHDSLGYLAERFGYAVVATVIPGGSTLGSPSSSDLAGVVDTMRTHDMDVIFADTTDTTALAEAVAAEIGSEVIVIELFTGSVGPPGSGAESLTGMLLTDAERISEALG